MRRVVYLGLALPLVLYGATLAAQSVTLDDRLAALELRPGDRLAVAIKDEPALSGEFPVTETGYVLLPALGFVRVAQRTFGEVRQELMAGYARQLVEPVIEIRPLQRVAVLGEVRSPGLYPADPTVTVGDVLALAGGLTREANRTKIALVRGSEVIRARLDPGSRTIDLAVRSGDQILVGERSWFSRHSAIFISAVASVAAAAVTSLIIR